MLTHTKAFSLTIAALLVLTLTPGAPTTAAPPEPLNVLSDAEAAEPHLSDFSAPSASSAVQAPGVPFGYASLGYARDRQNRPAAARTRIGRIEAKDI